MDAPTNLQMDLYTSASHLANTLGRHPTFTELVDHTGIAPNKLLARLQELREADLAIGLTPTPLPVDPATAWRAALARCWIEALARGARECRWTIKRLLHTGTATPTTLDREAAYWFALAARIKAALSRDDASEQLYLAEADDYWRLSK